MIMLRWYSRQNSHLFGEHCPLDPDHASLPGFFILKILLRLQGLLIYGLRSMPLSRDDFIISSLILVSLNGDL